MPALKPGYFTNEYGEEMVFLSCKEFDLLIEQLQEPEDVVLYHEAKIDDDGERIPLRKYVEKRKTDDDANL